MNYIFIICNTNLLLSINHYLILLLYLLFIINIGNQILTQYINNTIVILTFILCIKNKLLA